MKLRSLAAAAALALPFLAAQCADPDYSPQFDHIEGTSCSYAAGGCQGAILFAVRMAPDGRGHKFDQRYSCAPPGQVGTFQDTAQYVDINLPSNITSGPNAGKWAVGAACPAGQVINSPGVIVRRG